MLSGGGPAPSAPQGRGAYFDKAGILRDVVQSHLLQLLALLAMDRPASLAPDDVRSEKRKVLRQVVPVKPSDLVLGQYEGYQREAGVRPGSGTATFATLVAYINNERWRLAAPGVLFPLFLGATSAHTEPGGLAEGLGTAALSVRLSCVLLARWDGVPFILKAGKGLNERKSEIRVQLKDVSGDIFEPGDVTRVGRNELVLRMQPREEMYLKARLEP